MLSEVWKWSGVQESGGQVQRWSRSTRVQRLWTDGVHNNRTNSVWFSKVMYCHMDAQPHSADGKCNSLGKAKKYMGYAHKKFTILGGPQGSKVNRDLNREAVKGLGLSTVPLTTSQRWGNHFRDQWDWGIDKGHSQRHPWDDTNDQ